MMFDRTGSQTPSRSGHATHVLMPPSRAGEAWREQSSAGSVPSSARSAFDFGRMSTSPATRVSTAASTRLTPSCACGGSCPKCMNPTGQIGSGPFPTTVDGSVGDGGVADAGTAAADAGTAGDASAVADAGAAAEGAAMAAVAGAGVAAPAAPARRARLKSGPTYTPHGNVAPNVAGGVKNVPFAFDAVFDSAPADGVFPGCGEIHQDIKWDTAARTNGNTAWGLNTPHGGFPGTHPANTWIEDRDQTDTSRYGRRSGPLSVPVTGGDEYTNVGGARNMASGQIYHGNDNPSNVPVAFNGRWTFMVLVFDMCTRGTQIGSADFIVIDW